MEESIDRSTLQDGDFRLTKSSRFGGPVTCVAFSPKEPLTDSKQLCRNSFSFVAQGPYLTRYEEKATPKLDETGSSIDSEDKATGPQQLLIFTEDEDRLRGGGTIHGIHFTSNDENARVTWDTVVYGGKRIAFCNLLGSEIERRDVIRSCEEQSFAGGERKLKSSFLDLDDWIWSIETIPKLSRDYDATNEKQNDKDRCICRSKMTMVVGLARHIIEVWNVEEANNEGKNTVVRANPFRRLFLDPPTVVTSMDFTFLINNHEDIEDGNLWVAAGTSFHKIWVSSIPIKDLVSESNIEEDERSGCKLERADTSTIALLDHHLLQGHSGVVHSVRWFVDGDRMSLASTSDDRSVRKWIWDESQQKWIEDWVGWGHIARVWNVSPVYSQYDCSDSSAQHSSSLSPLLVSVAEDGTARVWAADSGNQLGCIHHSTTLWTVDTRNTCDGGEFIVGGIDGISSTYNVRNHIFGQNSLQVHCTAIPDDRPPTSTTISDDDRADKDQCLETSDDSKVKKKKKAKKKIQAQVIVGMKCWRDDLSDSCSKVVVATRIGSLMYFDLNQKTWESCAAWWQPSFSEKFGIQAGDGNCMAVHDGMSLVAIGTSRGDVILTPIQRGEEKTGTILLTARKLRSVQGMVFLSPSFLVSFHVRSVALWRIDTKNIANEEKIQPSLVLNVDTKGIPQCCAYDEGNCRLLVGDSRGNIAYFRTPEREIANGQHDEIINPLCIVPRVHQKQHVTSIRWLDQRTILSAGNDGCLHVSYLHGDQIQKGWSYPAPSLTGVTNIITSGIFMPTIIAGYHGNTYRVMDVTSGYEYLRCDTGGRQRILDCRFNIDSIKNAKHPMDYELVVCKAQKDGSNELFVQYSPLHHIPKEFHQMKQVSEGVKMHGETIFDSALFTLSDRDVTYLVTASEDCTSRISALNNGQIIDSVKLTPQESCCRCVTVSQIDEEAALLVIGGGKLSLQFFLVKGRSACARSNSTSNLEITFLGNGSMSQRGATIDHRINSVNATPISFADKRSYLVIAGDSEGCSHAFIVDEKNNERHVRGISVPTVNERPILCIETVPIGDRILVLMGTTGGEIDIYDLQMVKSREEYFENFLTLWHHIGRYTGHQMGTNTLSARALSFEVADDVTKATVLVVSGGDDQAICVAKIALVRHGGGASLTLVDDPKLRVIPEASFSAIKGVSEISFNDHHYLLSVGYSQQLSVWRFGDDGESLRCISRLPVDLGDVNCLSVYQSRDKKSNVVAVCGMGVEVFQSIN